MQYNLQYAVGKWTLGELQHWKFRSSPDRFCYYDRRPWKVRMFRTTMHISLNRDLGKYLKSNAWGLESLFKIWLWQNHQTKSENSHISGNDRVNASRGLNKCPCPSSPDRCFISVFVWFLCYRRCCTDELETLHADWTNVFVYHGRTKVTGFGHVNSIFTDRSKAVFLLWFTISIILCLCMFVFVQSLFWIAVWSLFGKKLLFWHSACNDDCAAVTLSASFFPFGVLERKVLGNCIDSWSLPSFQLIIMMPPIQLLKCQH